MRVEFTVTEVTEHTLEVEADSVQDAFEHYLEALAPGLTEFDARLVSQSFDINDRTVTDVTVDGVPADEGTVAEAYEGAGL